MAGMVNTGIFEAWDWAGKARIAEDRFGDYVTRNSRFVFQVTYAVLRNRADAEDAAQETFLKLYRLGGWESANDERAYLARAAWRIAISRKRPQSAEEPPKDVPCGALDPEELAIAANQEAWVHKLIDALPEDLRLPLVFSSMDGMTSGQIACLMELPEGTVRTRISRARQILRMKIEERYGKR